MIYHVLSAVFTFTFIVIPLGYFFYQKKHQPLPMPHPSWEKIPVLVLTLLFITLSFTGSAVKLPDKTEIWLEQSDETSIHISLKGSDWIIQDRIFIQDEITVYQALEQITQKQDLSIKTEYFEAFQSLLVQSIHIDDNGENNCYWQYYVNGELPMVGCDSYMIKNGDIVEWRFEQIPS